MRKTVIYVGITLVLLVTTLTLLISALNTPKQTIKQVPSVTYDIEGSFSHQAYGYLISDPAQSKMVYFPKIIDQVTGTYAYDFTSEEEISDVKTQVQISAVINRSGYWETEIELVPQQEMSGESFTFPIDTGSYLQLANKISNELGLGDVYSLDILLTAVVRTEATVDGQLISDNFIQTCELTLSSTLLEWQGPLELSRKGYQSGLIYKQSGSFGYSIDLLPNTLFGNVEIVSPSPEIKILRKLDPATNYRSDTIDNMNINFVNKLTSTKALSGINHTVKASAVLSNIDGEQVLIPLLPETEYTEDFTIRLPIDVALLYDIIHMMENVTSNDFRATYTLQVKVDVHTTATAPSVINETINAVLPLRITASNLTIEAVEDNTKSGTLTETKIVSNSKRSSLMYATVSLLCLTIVAGLWTGWSFRENRRKVSPVYQLWETAQQTMNKHKDIFVNVMEIPPVAENEKTAQIESLSELVKLSDSLLKPVLHQKDEDRHIFCVIDGMSRYVYMVIEPPPA